MKKILSILVFSLLFSSNAYAETINQRLDKIEQRLISIEESLDGTKLLKNLIGIETNLDINQIPAETKIGFKLNGLFCSNNDLFEKINIGYQINNNYDKEIKLVDAYFVARDLFDDEIFKAKIVRGIYLKPGKSKDIQGEVSGGLLGDSCEKIKQSRLPDLKVKLHVSKIAFGDNSIVEFINNSNSRKDMSKNENSNSSLLASNELEDLKTQIYGCWSIPLGLPYGDDLLVRIKLKLKPDGSIINTEILDKERMNKPGQAYYKILAESALRAVKLCQPLKVPNVGYDNWKELILNFDAREMLGG